MLLQNWLTFLLQIPLLLLHFPLLLYFPLKVITFPVDITFSVVYYIFRRHTRCLCYTSILVSTAAFRDIYVTVTTSKGRVVEPLKLYKRACRLTYLYLP